MLPVPATLNVTGAPDMFVTPDFYDFGVNFVGTPLNAIRGILAAGKRYEVDNSSRTLHGALLDAEILADVYLAMTGGQVDLGLSLESTAAEDEDVPYQIFCTGG